VNLSVIQPYIPARIKFALKPFYRTLFPNKLHVLLYPTFRCNYKCSYCPVVTKFDFGQVFPYDGEQSVEKWLEAFEKLPGAVIYVAGGEPFLYRGLPDLINKLQPKHQVIGVVTNLSVRTEVYERVEKKLHLNASFHREFVEQDTFVKKIHALAGKFHIHVNFVATPENISVLERVDREFSKENISLHVDPYVDPNFTYTETQWALIKKYVQSDRRPEFLDFEDYSPKQCSAGRNYINIAPNGDVFTCASGLTYNYSTLSAHLVKGHPTDLYRMGNIFAPAWALNTSDMVCSLPCSAACDRDAAKIRVGERERVAHAASSPD
jgi:MoaA/NifB/PqqE/SkfB family radical SAM enzyme